MTDEAGDAMTTTTTTYADAVRRALDDLPAARYLELVDGLDEHLAEVQADGGTSLAEVLGPPDAYAAELRSSAGLPPRATAAGAPLPPPVVPPAVAAAPARPPIDRRGMTRVVLVVLTVALAWWMLLAKEIGTAVLAVLVAGVLGVSWLVRRLLRTAALGDVAQRRASVGVTVGGLVMAACLGSMSNGGHGSGVVDYSPGVTFAPAPYASVAVPDFRGMTVDDAQGTAAQIGLATMVQVIGAEGTVVLEQTPPPGSGLMPGQSVTLLIGAGPTSTRPPSPLTTTTSVATTTLAPTTTIAATTTLAPTTTLLPTTTLAPTTVAGAPATTAGG